MIKWKAPLVILVVSILSLVLIGCDQEPQTINFDSDYSSWLYVSNRSDEHIDPIFTHANDESLKFTVHTQNHHPDPDSWYLGYQYETGRTVDSVEFTYLSTFNDAGQQGRLILEVWDLSPRLLWSKEVEWDNAGGQIVKLEDLGAFRGLEFRWQRTNPMIYSGSLLEVKDVVINTN